MSELITQELIGLESSNLVDHVSAVRTP